MQETSRMHDCDVVWKRSTFGDKKGRDEKKKDNATFCWLMEPSHLKTSMWILFYLYLLHVGTSQFFSEASLYRPKCLLQLLY